MYSSVSSGLGPVGARVDLHGHRFLDGERAVVQHVLRPRRVRRRRCRVPPASRGSSGVQSPIALASFCEVTAAPVVGLITGFASASTRGTKYSNVTVASAPAPPVTWGTARPDRCSAGSPPPRPSASGVTLPPAGEVEIDAQEGQVIRQQIGHIQVRERLPVGHFDTDRVPPREIRAGGRFILGAAVGLGQRNQRRRHALLVGPGGAVRAGAVGAEQSSGRSV